MASTKSPEFSATELELKRRGRRRLIGAATIGLLGIVFLPMIFDGEPKSNRGDSNTKPQTISVQIPAKTGQSALPAPAALAPVVPPQPAADAVKDAPTEIAKPTTEPITPISPPAPAPVKAEKPKAVAKPAAASAEKKGFAVQLGVFASAENAKQTITKMKEAKLPVYTDNIPIKSGVATRVRVGPFPTREKADSALAQVKLAGSEGKIVPLQ